MSVQDKISKKFRGIQGGLFEKVSKADVGTALNDLIAGPTPSIPTRRSRST